MDENEPSRPWEENEPSWPSALDGYPEETTIIGRLLIGYSHLELALAGMLGQHFDDLETGYRIVFRARSESERINIADAILRPAFANMKLLDKYLEGLKALRDCMEIRNYYAHSNFKEGKNFLGFTKLEELAEEVRKPDVRFRRVRLEVLNKQLDFFRFTERWLVSLCSAMSFAKRGKPIDEIDFTEIPPFANPDW